MRHGRLSFDFSVIHLAAGGILMAFVAALATSCGHMTPTSRSIDRVRYRVDNALSTNAHRIVSGPVRLQLRYNPCPCDVVLQVEAKIYDRWQYVRLTGRREKVARLIDHVAEGDSKTPFEALVILESALYHSPSGQNYYTLQLVDDQTIGNLND